MYLSILLLIVFLDNFHPVCVSPEAQWLSGWPGVTWWWPVTNLYQPAATRCCSLCLSLVNNNCTLKCLELLYHFHPLSLHFSPSCDSLSCVCISTTEACSIVSLRSMEPSSPADLFKTVQSYGLLNLCFRFTLYLTFQSASLSSCVVNTVQGSCSGLVQILKMLLQTKDGYDKELNGSHLRCQHKAPLWRQDEKKVDYTEDNVAHKTNGGQMD